jgi:hypothetical protein
MSNIEIESLLETVTRLKQDISVFNNQQVDDYNSLLDKYEELEKSYAIAQEKLELYREKESKSDVKKSKAYLSLEHEYSSLKENHARAKENLAKYRKLYDEERRKGFESKYYALQRDYLLLRSNAEKYNIAIKDERGRDNHRVLYFWEKENEGPYWSIASSHISLTYYDVVDTWSSFPMPKLKPLDIEILLVNSTGITLPVLFTTFGNFTIPKYKDEGPFGITMEILKGLEAKRDQFLSLFVDHAMHKQLDLLREITIDRVYGDDDIKRLNENKITNLYEVTNYLANISPYCLVGIDADAQVSLVKRAIHYLTNEHYLGV